MLITHFLFRHLELKKDVIPGQKRETWFRAEELGVYDLTCAEYCGLNHWNMYTKVIVMPSERFKLWLDEEAKSDSINNSSVTAQQSAHSTKNDVKN